MKAPANALKTSAYTTWMGVDGIGRTIVKGHMDIGIKEALENTAAVSSLFKEKKFPLLIDSRDIKYINKEARDHFSMRNRESVVNAMAILIQSPLSRIIGNFFMGLNKPRVPARLFTSEDEALQWLKKHV